MTSELKLETNRLNAEKSTGPKSPDGKSRSSMNAVKHGLRAKKAVLLSHETEEDYSAIHKAMLNELDPRGFVETTIAQLAIDSAWRLRRIPVFETQVLAYSQNRITKRHPAWDKEFPNGPHSQERAEWGRIWQVSESSLVNLRRYENALTRTFFRSLSELKQAQKHRPYLVSLMPPHPDSDWKEPVQPEPTTSPAVTVSPAEISPAVPVESVEPVLSQPASATPPAYSTVLKSAVSPPPAERIDPGHTQNGGQSHTLGSFGSAPEQMARPTFSTTSAEVLRPQLATEGRGAPEVAPESTATVGTGPVAQQSHNPIFPNELPAGLGSFGKQAVTADGTVAQSKGGEQG
jgi:hypothetical protein